MRTVSRELSSDLDLPLSINDNLGSIKSSSRFEESDVQLGEVTFAVICNPLI